MNAGPQPVDRRVLKTLVPIRSLSPENFEDLVSKICVETLPPGKTLFKQGERDNKAIYLLSGELDLLSEAGGRTTFAGGTASAAHPVAHQQPRPVTALTRTEVQCIRIDNDLLDILLTWDQSTGYVVNELEADGEDSDDGDWMTSMLQSNIFFQVPPANIQEMFKRMEAVPASAGDVIIRQGETGDYYFIIRQGRAQVSREIPGGSAIKLAELEQGDAFGEEALITECERNATVTMLSDGMLMRLSKGDFDQLLRAPVLQGVTLADGNDMTGEGAQWLDVRLESEFDNAHINGALNIPLYLLRLRIRELEPERPYLVYCDSGRRSAAAAYLLSEAGFDVFVLDGGFRSAPSSEHAA